MKKAILFLFLIAGTYSVCQAQLYIGGGISYGTNSDGRTEGSLSRDIDSSTLSINPQVGYIFNDRWSAGISLSFSQTDREDIYDTSTDKMDYSFWGISPFVRYTCFSRGGFSMDIDGRLNYNNSDIRRDSDYTYVDGDKHTSSTISRTNQYGISFSPVFVYDFSRHFRIETSLTLFSFNYNDVNSTSTTTREDGTNQKSEQSGFNVGLLGSGHSLNDISIAMVYKF